MVSLAYMALSVGSCMLLAGWAAACWCCRCCCGGCRSGRHVVLAGPAAGPLAGDHHSLQEQLAAPDPPGLTPARGLRRGTRRGPGSPGRGPWRPRRPAESRRRTARGSPDGTAAAPRRPRSAGTAYVSRTLILISLSPPCDFGLRGLEKQKGRGSRVRVPRPGGCRADEVTHLDRRTPGGGTRERTRGDGDAGDEAVAIDHRGLVHEGALLASTTDMARRHGRARRDATRTRPETGRPGRRAG